MKTKLPETLDLDGVAVPIGDYENAKALARVLYGFTFRCQADDKTARKAAAYKAMTLLPGVRAWGAAVMGGRIAK